MAANRVEDGLSSLQKAVEDAIWELGAWLTDNTVEVFEEEPEIDGIRARLNDALEATRIPSGTIA